MRKFIIKLLVFLSPLVVFFAWWEHGLATMPNDHKTKAAQLLAALPRCELLVLGSSHEQAALSATNLPPATVNIACGYQTLYADARLAAHYVPRMTNLKHVLIGVSYHTLEGPPASLAVGKPHLATAYHRYYHLPHDHWTDRLHLRNFSMIAWYGLPLSRDHLYQRFGKKNSGGGGTATAPSFDFNEETGHRRMAHHHAEMNPTNAEPNRVTLLNLVTLCQRARVVPVLITAPCHVTYRNAMNPQTYEQMQNLINTVCSTTGAKYFNYLHDPRFETSDYADCDHLNARGAEKFARLITDEVLGSPPRSSDWKTPPPELPVPGTFRPAPR